MLYAVAIAIHVLVAVLAVGLVGAVPLAARLAQTAGQPAGAAALLRALLVAMQIGLGVMLLTGVLLDLAVAGGFHHMRWFQVSIAVLVFLGLSLGRARAALREHAFRAVERWGWAMCASVAAITILMQLKPLR